MTTFVPNHNPRTVLAVEKILREQVAQAVTLTGTMKTSLREHLEELTVDMDMGSPTGGMMSDGYTTDDTNSDVEYEPTGRGRNDLRRQLAKAQQAQGEAALAATEPADKGEISDEEEDDQGYDPNDPFFVVDLGELTKQYNQWKRLLPRVEPWYAVKCNPVPEVVQFLSEMGTGLDCASKGEIRMALKLGMPPDRIIYANPCKPPAHLRYARQKGITLMTFDNEDELAKIRQIHPSARLVLRILVDDSKSICRFGVKFGAPPDSVAGLLTAAKNMNLEVVGVSFHVGSGCRDVSAFRDAAERARGVFEEGQRQGFHFRILDVGGGFPGANNEVYTGGIRFADIARTLGAALDEFFPPEEGVKIIAEPGRYFVSSALTLMVQVTSRRVVKPGPQEDQLAPPTYMYYLNDGVYGAFNCIVFDHYTVTPRVMTCQGKAYGLADEMSAERFRSSLWGPTCDSMDCILKETDLPVLQVGDWLCFPNMGAYTNAAASDFNGFRQSRLIFINSLEQGYSDRSRSVSPMPMKRSR